MRERKGHSFQIQAVCCFRPRGSYHFRTASQEPFALGPDGAEPSKYTDSMTLSLGKQNLASKVYT